MDALARQLETARSELYVPRPDAERAFDELLDPEGPVVLFVAGPGGIGKSTVLAHLAGVARQRGWPVRRIDLREVPARPPNAHRALTDLPERACVFVDDFEAHASLERLYFADWLPGLPDGCRFVLAGRREPDPQLLRRTGWFTLLRVLRLEGMGESEAANLLRRHGASESGLEARITAGQGHPLTLARLATLDFLPPGEVTDAWLTETLLGSLSDPRERAVLALALADGCDRALLAALIAQSPGERSASRDVEALEAWLRVQPFVSLGARGWLLHQCYADAVVRQARRNAPSIYRTMLRQGADHLAERLAVEQDPRARRAILRRAFAMTRQQAPATTALPYVEEGRGVWDDTFDQQERSELVEAARRHEGEQSAAVLDHHLARPGRGWVLRDVEGRIRGLLCEVDPEEVEAEDIATDPGVAAMVDRMGTGRQALLVRHWMCVEHHQQPCPTSAEVLKEFVAHAYERADLADHLVVDPATASAGAASWVDQQTVSVLDPHAFDEDGRQVRLVGWDLRRTPFPELLRDVMLLHLGEEMPTVEREERRSCVVPEVDYEDAVNRVLRHFHDDERLAESPLVAVVADPSESTMERARAVRQQVRAAAQRLSATARFDAPGELLERTYFTSPVPKQVRVAGELGMAYSTFRRHLADARRALTRALRSEGASRE